MQEISRIHRRAGVVAALGAAAVLVAGCHGYNQATSGYGVAWVSLGTVPSPIFSSYVVTVASVTVTDNLGNTYTAIGSPEPVDFVKLRDYRELWGSATIPNNIAPNYYKSATIVLDYSHAAISVLVNGVPQRASVINLGGFAPSQMIVNINLPPQQPLVIKPSYSTDNAQLLNFNFDLLATNVVVLATTPATVVVNPFVTVALGPPDRELIRVRGGLVNSSVPIGTFTVSERPFYEQAASLGSLTIFNDANALYTVDGVPYAGTTGLSALSQLPAGISLTASFTTFEPTATATAFAGKFNTVYTIAGAGLQSNLTENISGDVIAISSDATTGLNKLILRGTTVYGPLLQLAEGFFGYQDTDAEVIVGPDTLVTIDDSTATGLSYKSIAVGAHVEAVGIPTCTGTCGISGTGVWSFDSTSSSTGKVRLLQSQIFGSLLSATSTNLSMSVQNINFWPVSIYNFAGNGTSAATNSQAANYQVNTATANLINQPAGSTPPLRVPADLSGVAAGTPLQVAGVTNAFGAAPPDFLATTVYEVPGVAAQIKVSWSTTGSTTPFTNLTNGGFTINLQDPNLTTAIMVIGPQSVALNTLAASPQIITTATPVSIEAEPVYAPHYAFGTPTSVAGTSTMQVHVFVDFSTFVTNFVAVISASTPAVGLTANGYYDSANNTFVANTVSVVL